MSDKKLEVNKYLKSLVTKAATGNNEAVAADGGNLVAQQVLKEIIDAVKFESVLWNKAQKFTTGLNSIGVKIPFSAASTITEPTTGARAYWVEEAQQKTISKAQVGVANINFKKLVVRIPVTDELKNDASDLGAFVISQAAQAIAKKIEQDMFLGVGHSIKGIAGDGDTATVTVSASNDITEAELKTYLDALHPLAYKNAEWYVNAQQYSVITSLNYTNETSLEFEDGRYYLFGFPLNVVPCLVGNPYHVILGDFSKYVLAYRETGISVSEHIKFDYDESEYRIEIRIGGDVVCATDTLDDSATYGFFVCPTGGEPGQSSSSSSFDSSSSDSSATSLQHSTSSLDSSSSSSETSQSSASSDSSSSESTQSNSSSSSSSTSESSGSSASSNSSSSSSLDIYDEKYTAEGFTTEAANGNYFLDGEYGSAPCYKHNSYYMWLDSISGYWAISGDKGDPQNQWISSKDTAGGAPAGIWVSENGTVSVGALASSTSSSSD